MTLQHAHYRIGNAILALAPGYEPLLTEFSGAFGDCKVRPGTPDAAGIVPIRVAMHASDDGARLRLSFTGADGVDLLEAASAPFRLLRIRQCYAELPGLDGGWRVLVNIDDGNRALMRVRGPETEIDLGAAPHEFIRDFIVGVAQRAQSGVAFLHAASIGVRGKGALIAARSRGGKSTTALAMALRGHQFLGDDIAILTRDDRTLLPFAKSIGLREGPMADKLAARVQDLPHVEATGPDKIPRVLIRASDLFPGCLGGAVPLTCVFFLDGFGQTAHAERVNLSLGSHGLLRSIVSEITPSWGRSAGRDLVQFLAFVNLLGPARCYRVNLSTPEASAELLERLMEDACI